MQKRKGRIREFERTSREIGLEEAREERKGRREQAKERQSSRENKKVIVFDKKKKKVRFNKVRLIITAIAIVVVAVVGVSIKGIVDLKIEQRELEARKAQLIEQRLQLQEELKNINNLDYIEEQARIQLKLIMPGETLYIIEQDEEEKE